MVLFISYTISVRQIIRCTLLASFRSPYQANNEHVAAQEVTPSGMLFRLSVVDSNESARPAI